ncbi:MAG: site-specific integrase, partial [Gammaproteobacteria bacterium]|nr:site-specific integrase [Gammaproteobacteria bacterium]
VREPYPYPATPANIERAGRLRREITLKIKAGAFDNEEYRRIFPHSKHLQKQPRITYFGQMAQQWLDGVEVSANTRTEYRKILNRYWMPELATVELGNIRYGQLRALVNQIEWSSAKTRNNALIPLRGVLELAYQDELIDRNPAERLKNLKHQRPVADPFTRDEMETILGYLYKRHTGAEEAYALYFELAFWTGMRSSELLALTWDDVDFRSGYIRVSKARSKGTLNDRTKTAQIRDVLINPRALSALNRAKQHTYLRGGPLFRSPRTGEQWETEKPLRDVFRRAMQRLGIRHRPAYNTRHTYATMLLMSGANPTFVAGQLGHSPTMTLTVYSRWLNSEKDQSQLSGLFQDCPKNAPINGLSSVTH